MLDNYVGGNRSRFTCFLIPEVDYLKGKFGCKHLLDFDHIEREHAKLMHEFGMDVIKLPLANETHLCKKPCELSREDIPADTIGFIEKIYAEDIAFYKAFKESRQVHQHLEQLSQDNGIAYD